MTSLTEVALDAPTEATLLGRDCADPGTAQEIEAATRGALATGAGPVVVLAAPKVASRQLEKESSSWFQPHPSKPSATCPSATR